MTDPHDPASIPMLTDVLVPGRPPAERTAHTPLEEPAVSREAPPERVPAASATPGAHEVFPEALAETFAGAPAAAFDARDVEFIAERLRGRFSSYLREDARRVIEARCRDAIEEHTNWLVRQVTREVVSALEAEVAGWVRDAVREELARHTSGR